MKVTALGRKRFLSLFVQVLIALNPLSDWREDLGGWGL